MSETIEAYPLSWPVGRKRATCRERSRFGVTLGRARDEIVRQVQLLAAARSEAHPDRSTGSAEAFDTVQTAYAQAKQELGG